jgi:hypothetical protein
MNHNTSLLLPSRSGFARGGLALPRFDEHDHELVDLSSLGFEFPLEGSARGTNTFGDVLTQTVDGRDLNEIWREFSATLLLNNRRRNVLIDLLSFNVSAPIEDVPQLATSDFEEASEFGVPKGIRGGDYFSLGYDFKWYDLAVRYTWMYLAEASAAQVESLHNMALEADNRLIFTKIMKAMFSNINRTATIRGTAVNVYPFYNNDGTTPPDYNMNTFTNTHNHYLSSGAATVTFGDLDEMETHLVEHGYGRQQGSRLLLLVNRVELATIRGFRVASGATYDFVPAAGQAPFLLPTNTGGVVGQVPTSVGGLPVAGAYGNWIVIESDFIPAAYMLGFATGGEQQASNPVGFRQHANAGLRGMRQVKGPDPDYPLIDSYYQRGFGTGVRHRGAAAIMKISAGAYTIPAIYA